MIIRSTFPAEKACWRPTSSSLSKGDQLPGYGWVFPFGGDQINIGFGYVNCYKKWHQINATQFMGQFMETLPREWDLPSIDELKKSKGGRA